MRPALLLLCLLLTSCQGGCVRWQSQSEYIETRKGIEQGQKTDLVIQRKSATTGSATVPLPNVGALADVLGGGGLAGLLAGLAMMAVREWSRRAADREKDQRLREITADRDEGWNRLHGEYRTTNTHSKETP